MKKQAKDLQPTVLLIITAMSKIISVFLGPFLAAYFIQKSADSLGDLSVYYIFSYAVLSVVMWLVAIVIKNKFQTNMFRIGLLLNFVYVLLIVILQEKIIDHIFLIATLNGIVSATYYMPYNLFLTNKIKNTNRTEYMSKKSIITQGVGVLAPILLGAFITTTNYILTAEVVAVIALAQIILSFVLRPESKNNLPKFHLKKSWDKIKTNEQVRKFLMTEFFVGMNISGSALGIVATVLIVDSFKTDFNLGAITSIGMVLSIIFMKIYSHYYKHKPDGRIIVLSGVAIVTSVLLAVFSPGPISTVIYAIVYTAFSALLTLPYEIRLFNITNSKIIGKNNQLEFLVIREFILNLGRSFGYALILLAVFIGGTTILNGAMILLALGVLVLSAILRKVDKFER